MHSFVIHAGYEGSDKKKTSPFVKKFCNNRYFHNPHEASKKAFYCVYLHAAFKMIVKSKKK